MQIRQKMRNKTETYLPTVENKLESDSLRVNKSVCS